MFHAIFAATAGNPVTNLANFMTNTLTTIIPIAVAVIGFIFLLRHRIRDLVILLVIAGIVYSLVVDPTVISNLATFFANTLGL